MQNDLHLKYLTHPRIPNTVGFSTKKKPLGSLNFKGSTQTMVIAITVFPFGGGR